MHVKDISFSLPYVPQACGLSRRAPMHTWATAWQSRMHINTHTPSQIHAPALTGRNLAGALAARPGGGRYELSNVCIHTLTHTYIHTHTHTHNSIAQGFLRIYLYIYTHTRV